MVKLILESYGQRPSSTKKLCAVFLEVRHVCLPARHVFDDFLLLLLTRWWYFRKKQKKQKHARWPCTAAENSAAAAGCRTAAVTRLFWCNASRAKVKDCCVAAEHKVWKRTPPTPFYVLSCKSEIKKKKWNPARFGLSRFVLRTLGPFMLGFCPGAFPFRACAHHLAFVDPNWHRYLRR